MLPLARTENLTVQELGAETLVFDHETGKAHNLNPAAAMVWKHCDGQSSPAQLARRLDLPPAAVSLALEQLHRRKLMQGAPEQLSVDAIRSRRAALRKLAVAAAVIPAIMTITAPAAMAQASCVPLGGACTTTPQCCPGPNVFCLTGFCVTAS